MRKLDIVIQSLTKQEIRNFKIYTNRVSTSKRQKKILKLFEAYRTGEYTSDEEIIAAVVPGVNKNAFYRLRNRLLDEIDQSLLMLYNSMDDEILVTRCIMLSKISYHKNDFKSAYSLLLEAEKLAYKSEFFDILTVIYNEIITLSNYFPQIDPRIYIKKIEDVEEKYAMLSKLNRLIAEISYDLRSSNYDGTDKDTLEDLKRINERLSSSEIVKNSAQAQIKVSTCIRNILYQEHKLADLRDYLIETYNKFEAENLFTKTNHKDRIEMLIWIGSMLLKTKDFELSQSYTEKLKEELDRYNKLYYEKYKAMYCQSLFHGLYFTGKIDKSIRIFTTLKEEYLASLPGQTIHDLPMQDILLFQINLATACFAKQNYEDALDHIKVFFFADIFKKLPPNFKLNIFIVDLIIRLETNDIEYVMLRVKEIKRNLRNVLSKDANKRESEMLNILRKLAMTSDALSNKTVIKRIETFIANSPPFEVGSNELINYMVFLEAKLNRKTYFVTLQKYLVKKNEEALQ